ncbi:MAG: hypothetical protein IPJ19_00940 [Planctomycetes bacterium]|nr:hypothetical protein [Planctomycetota bacterium]
MLFQALLLTIAPSLPARADFKEVRKQYVELAGKHDKDAVVALWKANPGMVLPAIDADLEGSLREQEKGNPPNMEKVKEQHTRALFGAECATIATGHPILLDYASSFVGWNAEQKRQFRDGQKVCGASGAALKKGDNAGALAKGKECVERASALGDWWGTAMGYDAVGRAAQALGGMDDAITALSQARLLNHDLGLSGDEYEELGLLADLSIAGERWQRALVFVHDAQALAKALGDADGAKALEAKEASVRAKLGG